MMGFKLTKTLRDEICKRLMDGKFDTQSEVILKRRIVLADKVYNRKYSPAIRRKMIELPSGWLSELDRVTAYFGEGGGCYGKLKFDGHPRNLKFSTAKVQELEAAELRRRFLSEDAHVDVKIAEPDPLVQEWWAIKQATENLNDDWERLRNEVKGILYGATTSTNLVERWPEVAPFIENLMPV